MRIRKTVLVRVCLLLFAAAATATPLGSVSAAPTVAALWHMDEGAGATQMTDSSGNNNHGTLSKTESGLNGFQGLSYYFGRIGLPSFVEVPHSATLNPGTADITLSMYAKFPKVPPAAVGDYDMVRKGLASKTEGNYKMEIVPRNSGTIGRAYCLFKGTSGRGVLAQGPDLSDDQWYYIECKKTANQVSLRVKATVGSFDQTWTKNVVVGSIVTASNVYVGAKSPAGADQYTGAMDEVKIVIGS
ncbi:hypothetical protein BH20ACT21_BH20ACT21_14880 [soil metagenome]